MIEFELAEMHAGKTVACIKVIGVGGAGGNTVNSIMDASANDIDFIAVNTDAQALVLSKASTKIQIGVKSTKGLGTGADPELGRRAAEEDLDKVIAAVEDADIVFLAAGMGGGTGSGAVPVIARALREKGILTIAIVTKPFLFEGKRRMRVAEQAINLLAQAVDTLIIVPNQKLLDAVDEQVSMVDGFAMINEVLIQSVRGISDIITKPGHINVDFADVRSIMKSRGLAVMGTGKARGAHRAREAAAQAISSPLLENMNIAGVHSVLMNISGGKDLGLHEISEAASIIYQQAHEDANIIIGSVIDETLSDEVIVTIIATGFSRETSTAESQVPTKDVQIKGTTFDRSIMQKPLLAEPKKEEVTEVLSAEPVREERLTTEAVAKQDVQTAQDLVVGSHKLSYEAGREPLDLDDLDIPTYLRKQQQDEEVSSS